jgi:hypothetical protein
MTKITIFLASCLFCITFGGAISPQKSTQSPKSTFWIQNKTTHIFTHLYIVSSEDGDADDEFEDDGTDHCATSCADDGNQNSEFDPDEIMDLHLGKGKYDLMLQDKDGKKYIEDDIEYHSKSAGIDETNPFIIEDSKLKEIK